MTLRKGPWLAQRDHQEVPAIPHRSGSYRVSLLTFVPMTGRPCAQCLCVGHPITLEGRGRKRDRPCQNSVFKVHDDRDGANRFDAARKVRIAKQRVVPAWRLRMDFRAEVADNRQPPRDVRECREGWTRMSKPFARHDRPDRQEVRYVIRLRVPDRYAGSLPGLATVI